jgi:hypothetical protein
MLYPFELRALNELQTSKLDGGCSGGCLVGGRPLTRA